MRVTEAEAEIIREMSRIVANLHEMAEALNAAGHGPYTRGEVSILYGQVMGFPYRG